MVSYNPFSHSFQYFYFFFLKFTCAFCLSSATSFPSPLSWLAALWHRCCTAHTCYVCIYLCADIYRNIYSNKYIKGTIPRVVALLPAPQAAEPLGVSVAPLKLRSPALGQGRARAPGSSPWAKSHGEEIPGGSGVVPGCSRKKYWGKPKGKGRDGARSPAVCFGVLWVLGAWSRTGHSDAVGARKSGWHWGYWGYWGLPSSLEQPSQAGVLVCQLIFTWVHTVPLARLSDIMGCHGVPQGAAGCHGVLWGAGCPGRAETGRSCTNTALLPCWNISHQ